MSDWQGGPRPGINGAAGTPYTAEPPVVKIDLGLTGKQIVGGLSALAAMIVSGITAGYIFLPAKDRDLKALQGVVEVVRQEQVAMRDAMGRITAALDGMTAAVDRLQQQPPKVIERYVTRPIVPPKPR